MHLISALDAVVHWVCPMVRLLWKGLILLMVTLTIWSCATEQESGEVTTEYQANQQLDQGTTYSEEQWQDALGAATYQQLVEGIGREQLDLLAYGVGTSNIIVLVNAIADPTKIIELFQGSNQLSVNQVISLLNFTDNMIRVHNPPSLDTLGKIANLINNSSSVDPLKDIVHGVKTHQGQTGIERLTLAIALIDENTDVMPTILNDVASTESGLQRLLRVMNEVDQMQDLVEIINQTTAITNLTGILNSVSNPTLTQSGDGENLNFPSSSHPYANNLDETVSYQIPNSDFLIVTFDPRTELQDNHSDEIYLTDSTGNPVEDSPYTGRELSGKTVIVSGDTLNIRLVSDSTTTAWGYRVSNATAGAFNGTTALIEMVNNLGDPSAIADIVNGISTLSYIHMATILNNVNLLGTTNGADKLVQTVQSIQSDPNLSIGTHLVRLVTDMVNGSGDNGSQNIAHIVNGLDPDASVRSGLERLLAVMSGLHEIDEGNLYTSPTDIGTTDQFGRLTTLVNEISGTGAYNVVTLINQVDNDKLGELIDLVASVEQIDYLSQLINGLYNIDLLNTLLNEVENGPGDEGKRLLRLVNGLANSSAGRDKLQRVLNEVNNVSNLVEIINQTSALDNLIGVINDISNTDSNNTNGTTALVDLVNTVTVPGKIAKVINGISTLSYTHLSTLLNKLDNSLSPSGAVMLGDVIVKVMEDSNLTVENHLVRLITDMVHGDAGNGATNVANIINGLDPNASGIDGVQRLVSVLSGLSTMDQNDLYSSPDQTSLSDAFGRLTTLVNEISGSGADNIVTLVNTVDQDKISELVFLVGNVTTIGYLSDIINRLTNVQNLTLILNTVVDGTGEEDNRLLQLVNGVSNTQEGRTKLLRILNNMNNISNLVSIVNQTTQFSNLIGVINDLDPSGETYPGTDALVDLVNEVTVPAKIADIVNGVSGISYTHVATILNNLDSTISPTGSKKLADIISEVTADPNLTVEGHAVRLITDMISGQSGSGAVNVARIINGLDPDAESQSGVQRLLFVLTNMSQEDLDNQYNDAFLTGTTDHFGRLTTLINAISSGGADNVVNLINTITYSKLPTLVNLLKEINRIQHVADLINRLFDVVLLKVILDGADYTNLITALNEIGESTHLGGVAGQKSVGDMRIVAETINLLGYQADGVTPRSLAEQQRINTLLNDVTNCGIGPGDSYDLNNPGSHLMDEASGNCAAWSGYSAGELKRLSTFLLGMNDAQPVSIIIGDVSDTSKTVKVLNGMRDIQKLNDLINYLPGEVTSQLLNNVESEVMYTSMLFLLNRLSAEALASLVHYGTAVGSGTSRTGTCRAVTGFGPTRTANLMNAETGERLFNLINNFGWRTSIMALVCGFGTTEVSGSQTLDNKNSSGASQYTFAKTESIFISNDQTPGNRGDYTHSYNYNSTSCQDYYPEKIKAGIGFISQSQRVDMVIWEGKSFFGLIQAGPGMSAVWDIVMGEGFVAGLIDWGLASLPYPPELGYSDKNWGVCQLDPAVDAPIQCSTSGTCGF